MKAGNEITGQQVVMSQGKSALQSFLARMPRVLLPTVVSLALVSPLQTHAEEETDPVWRWMPPFHVQIPANWRPRLDDGGVGFYHARHPAAKLDDIPAGMTESEFERLPFGMVHVGRERPPGRDGTLEDMIGQFKQLEDDEKVSNFSLTQEDVMLGKRPAILLRVGADRLTPDGQVTHSDINMVLAREPDADGMFQMAGLAGTGPFFEQHSDAIKAMLAGAVEDRKPPLSPLREITYQSDGNSFRHTFGLAAAPDGVIALGDSSNERIRIFAPDGSVLHEWGSRLRSSTAAAPDAFKDGIHIAWGPQGRVYLLDGGYGTPIIRVFERDGTPVTTYPLDTKTYPERGLNSVNLLWVGETGELWLLGRRKDSNDNDVDLMLTLSPEGEFLTEAPLPGYSRAARMPDGGVVLGVDAERADRIIRLDARGQTLADWTYSGTGFAPLPGESRQYFSIEHLGTDSSGRIYVFDDSEDGIWIYSAEGVFQQVVPERGLIKNRLEDMVVSARGDLLVQDEPSLGSNDAPTLRWLENADPASTGVPIVSVDSVGSAPATEDTRTPELVALATEGKLTVRALRAFGQLDPSHDMLAIQLRTAKLDLYAADAAAIESWLVSNANGRLGLPAGSIEPLQLLAAKLREFEPKEATTPLGVCVCVDLDGDGNHSVMKHGAHMAQQVRLQAGALDACMQLIQTLPECNQDSAP